MTGPRVLSETSYFPVALNCGVVCALSGRESPLAAGPWRASSAPARANGLS